MGKKLDALLGRTFKPSKFKPLVNLALSRLVVLKNQRQVRCTQARSDVVQLLDLGHHERALIRVEHVIKEQNMLDVFVMIESYCNLLIERVNLIEQERVCPDELREAISSLLYAASRCGEFPELQEIRTVMTTRFGKEFAASAIELRNNCGVNRKMIQKLSTRQPSLENRMEVESLDVNKMQNHEANSGCTKLGDDSKILPQEKHEIMTHESELVNKETHNENQAEKMKQKNASELKRSMSASSSDSAEDISKVTTKSSDVIGQADSLEKEMNFDESDNETAHEESIILPHKQIPSGFRAGLKVGSGLGHPTGLAAERSGTGIHIAQNLNMEKAPISVRTRQVRGY
ncbi:ist1-like protein [Quercus suber]|uniref:Ist1-like protein n=1 Tax=Quercus suber TaxID=58331 RepID=A0AAW0IGB6_QUESU